MKKTTAHAIENLSIDLNMADWCGKITLVLRSEKQAKEDRPNAFVLTRGKNGWTRCRQDSYYFCLGKLVGSNDYVISKNGQQHRKVDYREYNDAEIMAMVEEIRAKGITSKSEFGGWYIVNE